MSYKPVSILAIPGSLRKESFNRSLIQNAIELAPDNVEITMFDLHEIPLYNNDVENQGAPESVERFKDAIRAADGMLIATPEYNYSYPGVLKNAIDWASRPPRESPLSGKTAAIMGASGGASGTVRAQMATRLLLSSVGVLVVPKPDVYVRFSSQSFDENRQLNDEATRKLVAQLVARLADYSLRFRD